MDLHEGRTAKVLTEGLPLPLPCTAPEASDEGASQAAVKMPSLKEKSTAGAEAAGSARGQIAKAEAVSAAPGARRTRYSARRFRSRLNALSMAAVDCLEEIITDSSAKPADRVSAAKLAFDAAGKQPARTETDGVLRVLFDGMPQEYAE